MTAAQGDKLQAKFIDDSFVKMLVTEDCDVYNTEGDLLMKYRKGVMPLDVLSSGYNAFKGAIKTTQMRGIASGGKKPYIKTDGKLSKTQVGSPVESSVVGFMDESTKMPFCRKTAFTKDFFETYQKGIPFVEYVDKLYSELCPDNWAKQIAIARGTNRNFRIADTAFTTVTVNRNFRTAVHKDSGDFNQGFGNLCVYREGQYEGAHFCLPEYGVAVDLQNGDMLFADVHRWHGNTEFKNTQSGYMRVSFVMYYREYMINCKSPSQELAKAKTERGGYLKL